MKALHLFIFLGLSFCVVAQQGPGEQRAETTALRMRDSLALDASQKDSILAINLRLLEQGRQARSSITDLSLLTTELQRIENQRDGLYRVVLGVDKYVLYKQKKRSLIAAN